MHARVINAKAWILAAAVAMLLLVGAGVAYAADSGGDPSRLAGGANLEKARSIALDRVSGRVTRTEAGDEEVYYEVEVTKDDGSQVDVHLDRHFKVLGTPADNEGPDDMEEPGDSEDSGGRSHPKSPIHRGREEPGRGVLAVRGSGLCEHDQLVLLGERDAPGLLRVQVYAVGGVGIPGLRL
jgi:hypothetical protein